MVAEPFHRFWIDAALSADNLLILAARNHAKSTYLSGVLPLWEIGSNPAQRILLVTAVDAAAGKFMLDLQAHLEHPAFRAVFPDLPRIRKSTERELYFDIPQRDPTFRVVSIESKTITGSRADHLLCDDVVVDSNSDTPGKREDLRHKYIDVLLPLLEQPHGRVTVVGTPWAETDLYHTMERDLGYTVIRAPAISEAGEILWPGKFSALALEAIRRPDPVAFAKNYLVSIASYSGQVFQRSWFLPTVSADEVPKLTEVWISADTAISTKAGSDYTAFVTLGRDARGTIYVLHAERGQWAPGETKERIVAGWKAARAQYGPIFRGFLTEQIKEAAVFVEWVRESLRGNGVTLMPHGGLAKAERARAIVPRAENGQIRFVDAPWNDAVLNELSAFTPDDSHAHDDYVDALVYGCAKLWGIEFTRQTAQKPGRIVNVLPTY